MITEDYCSYEVSKLLKEKGFDETCYACYEYFSSSVTMYSGWPFEYKGEVVNNSEDRIKCPTHQMAMKWLREIYKIYIDIETCYTYINKNENFEVTGYEFTIHSQYEPCYEDHETYNSYEEAVEAALKYTLENLI